MINNIRIDSLTDDIQGALFDQVGGPGDLNLNGNLVVGGAAAANESQIASITSTSDNSGVVFTISGKDSDGLILTESITGPNNGTVNSICYFKEITGVSCDSAITGNVSCGWVAANGAISKSIAADRRQTPFNQSIIVLVSGVMNLTAEYTVDKVDNLSNLSFAHSAMWISVFGANRITINTDTNISFPVTYTRLKINSYSSGSVQMRIIQGG